MLPRQLNECHLTLDQWLDAFESSLAVLQQCWISFGSIAAKCFPIWSLDLDSLLDPISHNPDMRRGRFLKAVNKSQFPSSSTYLIDLILISYWFMHCLSDTRIARAYLRPLLANTCTDHGRVLPWEGNSDSIKKMLPVVHEANRNEFSAALAFKLPLLKTHILSPDSHGRSGVKLSLSSDIVGIRKHIHS